MRIRLLSVLSIIMFISIMPGMNAAGQTTTVYVVRHAEKNIKDSTNKNPPLSKDGEKRAKALQKKLKGVKLDAVFSTNTIRTMETAGPAAKANKLTIQQYDAKNLTALAEKIKTAYAGKNVLVVEHSNTVLPTVNALGGITTMAMIPDNVYHLFFKVMVDASGKAQVVQEVYGKVPASVQ
jgi:phosphohistidine phosphatase SixA